ncbi:MAG TPA: YndJ family protein [Pyrinomonadaceae bacterium]|nr:YndJ family protein [Pyrinomonadaceae bacterium]
MNFAATFARRSALVGAVVWFLLLPTTTTDSRETELVHKVVFFAILVVVPLVLSLLPVDVKQRGPFLYRLIVYLQPIAAIPTIVSFFVGFGPISAALSFPWTILTVLISLLGLYRIMYRGREPLPELSIDGGMLFVSVAGVWLVIYRLGEQPFDYGEMIILLTVVHFHLAAYATLTIVGLTGRALAGREYPPSMLGGSACSIVAAIPLVAFGITYSPWMGFFGTLLLALGLVLLAVLTVGWVIPLVNGLGIRVLFLIAASSSCAAMVLAGLYAYSVATKTLIIDIPTMAMTHGLLNAFGFVTCSLIAWSRIGSLRLPASE